MGDLPKDFGPSHPDWNVPSKRNRYLISVGLLVDDQRRRKDEPRGINRKFNLINLMVPTYGRSKTKLPQFVDSALEMSSGKIVFTFCLNKSDTASKAYLTKRLKDYKSKYCIVYEDSKTPNLAKYFNQMYNETKFKGDDTLITMLGDDMIFKAKNFDDIILKEASATDGKVIIYCNDDYIAYENLCVNLFTSRQLVESSKKPFMCELYPMDMIDEVWMEVGRKLDCLKYLKDVVIKHNHSGPNPDKTFSRLQTVKTEAYNHAQECEGIANEIALNVRMNWKECYGEWEPGVSKRVKIIKKAEKPILSILICHLPSRANTLNRLLEILKPQAGSYEVLIDGEPTQTTGEKRNNLLAQSKGKYIVYIDDDDYVTEDYVKLILEAVKSSPDCVGMWGTLVENGAKTKKFEHSIKYKEWGEKDGKFTRNPNHLNPIKREHAIKVKFPARVTGEDNIYSMGLLTEKLLKTEKMIDKVIYFYVQ